MTITTPRFLSATSRAATPWKNGLGVTREIAVHPPGAGLDDFDWRVSMATVDAGGPFSSFPGVDRILAVLEGRLALKIDGGAPIALQSQSPPLAFAGDVPVESDLLAGPVTDLNVMSRRGRVRASLERLRIDASIALAVSSTTIILSRTPGLDVVHRGRVHALSADDAIVFDQGDDEPVRLETPGPSIAFVIRLTTT